MSKHTAGPWTVSGLDPHVIGPVRILVMDGTDVPQHQAVARILDRGPDTDANAHLIAAAPELLDALKALLAAGDLPASFDRDRAVAAIAKAEGR